MRIRKIQIKNFKSLVEFELEDLKPFCAFVGPNASGKSNIFEALEFCNYFIKYKFEAPSFFGGKEAILSYLSKPIERQVFINQPPQLLFFIEFNDEIFIDFDISFSNNQNDNINVSGTHSYAANKLPVPPLDSYQIRDLNERRIFFEKWKSSGKNYYGGYEQFIDSFSRIFVGKSQLNRTNQIQYNLVTDASNQSQIIGKIFEDDKARTDFIEWLRILIPEFKNIKVFKSTINGSYDFFLYEKSSNKPFPKYLISDGTYNILALMAAVYQTDQPQFLCIEEPENGLHPQAIQLIVDFFREKCEEKDHHIWLNTHSQTLVRCLEINEVILVNKVNGETQAKQLTKEDSIDIKTDEAWLSNALGGGVLWSK